MYYNTKIINTCCCCYSNTVINTTIEWGPMPNVMAALLNIGGDLCKSSVILFLVPRCKLWLTPTTQVPCSNPANTGERKLDARWILQLAKFRYGARAPRMYSEPTPETAKHHAMFGWPPLSDSGAVTKPRCKTHWNLLGCTNSPTDLSR